MNETVAARCNDCRRSTSVARGAGDKDLHHQNDRCDSILSHQRGGFMTAAAATHAKKQLIASIACMMQLVFGINTKRRLMMDYRNARPLKVGNICNPRF